MALGLSMAAVGDPSREGWLRVGGGATAPPAKTEDPQEEESLAKLQEQDRLLRQLEAAQLASAGPYVKGVPILSYETGPDGRRYVTAVKVPFDTSPAASPEESLRKAQAIRRAASAAADPAAQDPSAIAAATMLALQAQKELAQQQESANPEKAESKTEEKPPVESSTPKTDTTEPTMTPADAPAEQPATEQSTTETQPTVEQTASSQTAETAAAPTEQMTSSVEEPEAPPAPSREETVEEKQTAKSNAAGSYIVDLAVTFTERRAAFAYTVATYAVTHGKMTVTA